MRSNRRIQIAALAVLGAISCGLAQADTFYVNGDCGNDAWSGKSQVCQEPDGPKATIQAGIDAAKDSDEIVVWPGTYEELIDFAGKAITLRSRSGDPNDTIIDGNGSGPVVRCINGERRRTVLRGFTITGGVGDDGGGMLNVGSSPTVDGCIFFNNSASNGGGMENQSGSSPRIVGCLFEENHANVGVNPDGGGMRNMHSSNPTLIDCTFINNTAERFGGAIANFNSRPCVINSEFLANEAQEGGGMFNLSSSPNVTNCKFRLNRASSEGGGMNNNGPDGGVPSDPNVMNCVFYTNHANLNGGGMFNNNGAGPKVTNCTFWSNTAGSGGGMLSAFSTPGKVQVTNGIFGDNSPDQIVSGRGGVTEVTYSDIQGGWPGEGNIDDPPLFVDPDKGDLHLSRGSPCIDTGDPNFVPWELCAKPKCATDMDAEKRVWNGRVDMGADEFDSFVFADMNCDGSIDLTDVEAFILALLDPPEYEKQYPDCEIDLADASCDGSVDLQDVGPFIRLLLK